MKPFSKKGCPKIEDLLDFDGMRMYVLFVEAEKAEVSEDLLNRLQENYDKILSLKPAN